LGVEPFCEEIKKDEALMASSFFIEYLSNMEKRQRELTAGS
jgi:hypothetical protein